MVSIRPEMKATVVNDPVVQAYMRDVDRSLLRENLKLTPGQRLEKLVRFASFASTLRHAGPQSKSGGRRNKKR